jgi:hypothetical protein
MLKEAERQAYDAFMCEIGKTSMNLLLSMIVTPDRLADWMASCFIDWLDKKITATTGQLFRVGLHFVKVTCRYHRFRYSISCGDAIDIEFLWTEFSGVWLLLQKRIST